MSAHEEIAVEESGPLRLDVFLGRRLGLSRRQVRERIAGGVRINGKRAGKGSVVQRGDVVRIAASAGDVPLLPQPDLAVPILFTDDALVAVNKPAGVAGHALRAGDRDTVANFLVGRFADLAAIGPQPFSAGLVHRLDTVTSGVLLAARSLEVYRSLRRQFTERRVRKVYLALVLGDFAEPRTLSTPIAHAPRHPKKMIVCAEPAHARALRARPAETRCRPLERFAQSTLLQVEIPTGVRHQIRVHLAAAGHAIAGDRLYGPNRDMQATRTFLHAARLTVRHPTHGDPLTIEAPLPEDFAAEIARRRRR